MTTADWLSVGILCAYFVGVGSTDVVLLRRMGRRLQEQHPDAWKALDVKSVHVLAFNGYFRYNKHLDLNDRELNSLVNFKKRFDSASGLVFVVVALGIGAWLRRRG